MSHYTAVTTRIYWSEALDAIRRISNDAVAGNLASGDGDQLIAIGQYIKRLNAHQPPNPSDLEMALEFFKLMGFARPEEGLTNYKKMTVDQHHSPYRDGPPGTLVILDEQHCWYFDPNGRLEFIAEANP